MFYSFVFMGMLSALFNKNWKDSFLLKGLRVRRSVVKKPGQIKLCTSASMF